MDKKSNIMNGSIYFLYGIEVKCCFKVYDPTTLNFDDGGNIYINFLINTTQVEIPFGISVRSNILSDLVKAHLKRM